MKIYYEHDQRWRAWAGSADDLRRICAEVEYLAGTIESPMQSNPEYPERCIGSARLWARRTGVSLESPPESLSDILDRVDPDSARFLQFRVLDWSDRVTLLRLDLDFESDRGAVELSVRSEDETWANDAYMRLSREVERRVPRWSGFRGLKLGLVPLLMIFGSVWALASPVLGVLGLPSSYPLVLGAAIGLVATLPYSLSPRIRRWLFPSVELISGGAKSTVSRRIIFAGGVLLNILVGIYVNLIS